MISRITILSGKDNKVIPKTNPEELFHAHPLWARDIELFSPWNLDKDDDPRFSSWISGSRAGVPVAVCGSSVSSFEVAWELERLDELPEWGSVICADQESGRGQVRREWVSPAGNLYATLKWPNHFNDEVGKPRSIWGRILPLLVGFFVCRALNNLGVECKLKWPNDILVDGHKVGGMLIEERDSVIMVGIGLNLDFAPVREQLRKDHAVEAGKVNMGEIALSPLELWVEMVKYFKQNFDYMIKFQEPELFLEALKTELVWFGEKVKIVDGPKDLSTGIIKGLCTDGGLIIESLGKEYNVYSASIMPL